MKPRIFILDDESSICVALSLALKPKYEVSYEADPERALERLRLESFDLILLDLRLGNTDGLQVLQEIHALDSRIPVIIMTAYGSISSSVEAMKLGAFNYLTKPLDHEELEIFIEQALQFRNLSESARYLDDQMRSETVNDKLVGESASMQHVLQMVDKFSSLYNNILLYGESGTGKKLVAQAIHIKGNRKHFVSVNCAAHTADELEEELFGYKYEVGGRIIREKTGKMDYANQGTLYLDGIGDIPLPVQAKLLSALEDNSFTPIGSNELHRFDTRIISATRKDLLNLVAEKKFRKDLFYRLNTVEIALPPLRERREDIPYLCEHFIRNSRALQKKLVKIRGITPHAQELLISHDYPGNVRELQNAIEYAGIISSSSLIHAKDLPYRFTEKANEDFQENFLVGKTLRELEREAITASYNRHNGKRKAIAEELGISERGLWNKLKEYDLS